LPFRCDRPQLLRGVHVLVVEDDADQRELLRLHLETEGAHVEEASGTKEALATVESVALELVLTDVHMPGGDGIWLLSHIRRLRPRMAVVAVTGLWDPEAVAQAGFDAVIQKPFKWKQLSATVALLLAARAA
jgi:CheY-like chemotaxis protein